MRVIANKRWEPQTLGQYHGLFTALLLNAPDRFQDILSREFLPDQQGALIEGFERLKVGFYFAHKKIKDDRLCRIADELIDMALEAFLSGENKKGAHILQEWEGLIWPSYKRDVKYGVEAERRTFGENILYADIVVSPYPYEGTAKDLSIKQAKLLHLCEQWCRFYLSKYRDFRHFSWVMDSSGAIRRTSSTPTEDEHPVLKPVQRSWGYKRLKELAEANQIEACVLMEVHAPQGNGLIIYDLEQCGHARISARQMFKRFAHGIDYDDMRYHLEEPQFFAHSSVQRERD